MKHVRIAELKAKLSEFLRSVQAGESITVCDRNTSIARIVPIADRPGISIRRPTVGSPAPNKVPLPVPVRLEVDALELLLEDRHARQ